MERNAAQTGQPPAYRGLSGTAQTDQGDAVAVVRRSCQKRGDEFGCVLEQCCQSDVQCLGERAQQQDRAISGARLDGRNIAFGHARLRGEDTARHAPACTQQADTLSERLEKGEIGVGLEVGGWGGVGA